MTWLNRPNQERDYNVPKTENLGTQNQALSDREETLRSRSYDVNSAFKQARKLITSGVINPSKYALQKWAKSQYGQLPPDQDIAMWQEQWFKEGLIEPVMTPNGKKTFKLK
jgi:hypothetical protein